MPALLVILTVNGFEMSAQLISQQSEWHGGKQWRGNLRAIQVNGVFTTPGRVGVYDSVVKGTHWRSGGQ